MIVVRRTYIFLIAAITLEATAWALIYLLRNLLSPGLDAPGSAQAFQIAVIVVTLPIYLAHWLWAQRLAARDPDERAAALRAVYLYGLAATFLLPWLANATGLIRVALPRVAGVPLPAFMNEPADPRTALVDPLVALAVLGLLWLYHWRVVGADNALLPPTGLRAAVRRLYVLGFCAAGLAMTATGTINLLRWVLFQLGSGTEVIAPRAAGFAGGMARLAVGLPLWLVSWSWAERLLRGAGEDERRARLRWFYLYAVIFVAVLSAVTDGAMILAGVFRKALAVPAGGDIRGPLPVIAVALMVWAYHARVLRRDAAAYPEQPRQAGIRRLYTYLVAVIGLAAVLVGLGGVTSVLIRLQTATGLAVGLKGQLAVFAAALLAGLPVWLLAWRRAQAAIMAPGDAAVEERRSLTRKLYLYLILLATAIVVVTSAVYVVYRLVSRLLGINVSDRLGTDLAQAIAFALIAGAAWAYHAVVLRRDGELGRGELARRAARLRLVVADAGEGRFAAAVVERLRLELPELAAQPLVVGPEVTAEQLAALGEADLIAAPWPLLAPGPAAGPGTAAVAAAIGASRARKLLAPAGAAGWDWAGVDRWSEEALCGQTVYALRRIVQGDEVVPDRPLSLATVAAIALGIVAVLGLLGIPIFFLLQSID
jgi:hypothetical protein